MTKMPAAWMNRIALVLFIAASTSFVAFHFVEFWRFQNPAFDSNTTGWMIWPEFVETLKVFSNLDVMQMIFWSGFLTSSFLLVSSPFLVAVLRMSRLAWWFGALMSGAATLAFGFVVLPMAFKTDELSPGAGCVLLSSAMLLNLLGFCFIRREIPANPVIEAA